MSGGPKFSVVTIAYNNLAGLKRTVNSVRAQTFTDYEHVIIDGASTDGTQRWLRALDVDHRRQWLSQRDNGIYDAMNKGLERCSGELVMMLNSGESLCEPGTLAHIERSYRESAWKWCYGSVRMTDQTGRPVRAYSFDPFNATKFVMGLSWIPHATVCIRRSLYDDIGGYRTDIGTAADQELLMRALRVAKPHVITWYLCDYEMGGVSSHHSPRQRELAWHKMRALNNLLWRGSPSMDRAISELLSLRKPLRIALKQAGDHRLGWRHG